VGGQAQTPGMGHPLAIEEDQVRLACQGFKCIQEHRDFAKGQESGDIGHRARPFRDSRLQKDQIRIGQHHNGGQGSGAAREGDIGPGDTSHGSPGP